MAKWKKYTPGEDFIHDPDGKVDIELFEHLRKILDDPRLKDCKIKWQVDKLRSTDQRVTYKIIITNPYGVKVNFNCFAYRRHMARCSFYASFISDLELWRKRPVGPDKTRYFLSGQIGHSQIVEQLEKRLELSFEVPVRTFYHQSEIRCWRHSDNRIRAEWSGTFTSVFVEDLVALDGWTPCSQSLTKPGAKPWFYARGTTPEGKHVFLLFQEHQYIMLEPNGKYVTTEHRIKKVDCQFLNQMDRQLLQAAADSYMNHIVLKE